MPCPRRIGRVLAFLALCVVVQGAAQNPIIGFWQALDGSTIEFFENGGYLLKRAPAGPGKIKFVEVTTGTYDIPEAGRLRLAMGGQTEAARYRLQGNRLTILFAAEVQHYVRATPPD